MGKKMHPRRQSLHLVVCGLFALLVATGCSLPKRKPLYLQAGFDSRQIDTITVLRPVDLRHDRSLKTDYVSILANTTKGLVKRRKYKVEVVKDPSFVAAVSEEDLENPSPEWIRNLGPRDAHWVLLPSIEYVTRFTTADSEAVAEVKGMLFDKASGTVVWRGAGKGHMHVGILFGGLADNDAVRVAASDLFLSLPRKGDSIEEYESLEDPSIPLTYDKETLPRKGMTKQEVQQLFGETGKTVSHEKGETWYYHLNLGHAFIPFAGASYRPNVWVFEFNREGVLTRFHFTDRRISAMR